MGLNIKAVSELTGVPLHTLRAWERRYGIPRPNRNADNRYRLYDEQDIADVLWMKRQVEQGVSPAQASAMLREMPRETIRPSISPAAQPIAALQSELYYAFVRRDEITANQLLNQAWSTYAPEQVVLEVLQPTMYQIGSSWQRNTLSVEQEHFASNLMRQRLYALIQAQPTPALTAPQIVAAGAPEEQHDLGLLIFTLLAKRQGWNVLYLGQRTPLRELHTAAKNVRYIVLSVSTVTGLASLLPLWSEPLPPAPLMFGGELFNEIPRLREHVPGAFLGQDAVAAIHALATSAPRASEWKPARHLLSAARELDVSRLSLAAETVSRFFGARTKRPRPARGEDRQTLTESALFLTDALSSALAFDAPELMDAQGTWLWQLMQPRHVPPATIHQFLKTYRSAAQLLSPDTRERVDALVARLAATEPAASTAE